jgi:hypothetical protein
MMQKVLALAIMLTGIGGGLALGVVMRPGAAPHAGDGVATESEISSGQTQAATGNDGAIPIGAGGDGKAGIDREYVKIGRQMIIPVVSGGETRALMLFDLAIDVPRAMTERTYAAEPRLRDAFLRILFEMSYTGAFSSTYTDARVVEELREKLRAAARRVIGFAVDDVLILDIMRQEL